MKSCALLVLFAQGAQADSSSLLQIGEANAPALEVSEPSVKRCWQWVVDKFWDGLAWEDQEGDDNFIGKMLNPTLGMQTYGSGGPLSGDVSALLMSGIIGMARGERHRLRSDRSIEGWRVREAEPCRGSIRNRDVTPGCCSGMTFALAAFPRLNHVAILLEAHRPGGSDTEYNFHVLDPTVNYFHEDALKKRRVKVLMEELHLASQYVKSISGAMEAKGEKAVGLASYDQPKQYFISLQTFFENSGDLRYPLSGEDRRYRTFKGETDPTVCFGHGELLRRAGWRWSNGTSAGE